MGESGTKFLFEDRIPVCQNVRTALGRKAGNISEGSKISKTILQIYLYSIYIYIEFIYIYSYIYICNIYRVSINIYSLYIHTFFLHMLTDPFRCGTLSNSHRRCIIVQSPGR